MLSLGGRDSRHLIATLLRVWRVRERDGVDGEGNGEGNGEGEGSDQCSR